MSMCMSMHILNWMYNVFLRYGLELKRNAQPHMHYYYMANPEIQHSIFSYSLQLRVFLITNIQSPVTVRRSNFQTY